MEKLRKTISDKWRNVIQTWLWKKNLSKFTMTFWFQEFSHKCFFFWQSLMNRKLSKIWWFIPEERQQKNLTAKKSYSFINESYRNLNDIFNFLYLKLSCLFSKLDIAKWDGITPHDLRFWKVWEFIYIKIWINQINKK